jgi:hypothetical protein
VLEDAYFREVLTFNHTVLLSRTPDLVANGREMQMVIDWVTENRTSEKELRALLARRSLDPIEAVLPRSNLLVRDGKKIAQGFAALSSLVASLGGERAVVNVTRIATPPYRLTIEMRLSDGTTLCDAMQAFS